MYYGACIYTSLQTLSLIQMLQSINLQKNIQVYGSLIQFFHIGFFNWFKGRSNSFNVYSVAINDFLLAFNGCY